MKNYLKVMLGGTVPAFAAGALAAQTADSQPATQPATTPAGPQIAAASQPSTPAHPATVDPGLPRVGMGGGGGGGRR